MVFPFCCITGALSVEAVATASSAFLGLAAGEALHVGVVSCPPAYKDANVPVVQALEEHKKLVKRTYPVQRALIVAGTAAALTAALGEKNSQAAGPLAVAAAVSVANVAFALGFIRPVNSKLSEISLELSASPTKGTPKEGGNEKEAEEAAARELLRKWVRLHTVRTALAGLAFGSTLCGVLLLTKKGSKA